MGLRVLVVGGGAREHALVWQLTRGSRVDRVWCAPGNAGTAALVETVPVEVTDLIGLVAAAGRLKTDLVVIGPEAPLAAGLADRLAEAGIRAFGPTQTASRIESSKVWAKGVMAEAGVPTARSIEVRRLDEGRAALADLAVPVVVKADGLAAGKGVIVATDRDRALLALADFLDGGAMGDAGRTVLLEECLVGTEVSVLALTDGKTVQPLPAARDHKRAFDGDRGPNTGGMGAYAPAPELNASTARLVRETILEPTVRALAARGAPLRGVLYAGLMLTENGPKTLEFNARFGDPEAQALLPLLETDLAELLLAVADGALAHVAPPTFSTESSVALVLAAEGYPGTYASGAPIAGLDRVPDDVLIFHGGTRLDDGRVVTAGGRVLTVVGRGADLATARGRAYAGAAAISFPGRWLRGDIAAGPW